SLSRRDIQGAGFSIEQIKKSQPSLFDEVEFFTEEIERSDTCYINCAEVFSKPIKDKDPAGRVEKEDETLVVTHHCKCLGSLNKRWVYRYFYFYLRSLQINLFQAVVSAVQYPEFVLA